MSDNEVNKIKLFKHLKNFTKKNAEGELIDLYSIYEDYEKPPYDSPRRILHSPKGKGFIQNEIEENDMEVEKVIRYSGRRVYSNYSVAIHYLMNIDAYNKLMIFKLMTNSDLSLKDEYISYLFSSDT